MRDFAADLLRTPLSNRGLCTPQQRPSAPMCTAATQKGDAELLFPVSGQGVALALALPAGELCKSSVPSPAFDLK